MQFDITVDESKLINFSQDAKLALKRTSEEYINNIVNEARQLENHDRVGSNTEIITSHIEQAKINYIKKPKKTIWKVVLSVIVDILLLLIGFLFDKDRMLTQNWYLILFVVIVIITIVLLIIKYSKGEL